ncbi:HAD-IB family hydrolase [Streptomyces gobitricini]|uniref:HAD-IB family hydrolase n=1 Tax=Streptomyces gobitricini TaxID=68211 RepID=A0ABN3N2I0_9ACTN
MSASPARRPDGSAGPGPRPGRSGTREELARWLRDIDAAPPGPSVGAYFDFDGTLIRGHSAAAFCVNRLRHGEWPTEAWHALTSAGPRRIAADLSRARSGVENHAAARLGAAAAAHWHGRPVDELHALADRVFAEDIAPRVLRDTWMLARAHQARGHTVVIATAASTPQVAPLARALGVERLLCTPVRVAGGRVDCRTQAPLCAGDGKLRAVREHAAGAGVRLADSFAYCDGYEDLPLLESVGRPRVVNPRGALREVARERGWPVARPGPEQRAGLGGALVSTLAAAGATVTALSASLAVATVTGSRSDAATTALRVGSDLVLRAAGVRVDVVTGAAHLRERRPAVFVANHASPVDAVVLAHLLRDDWCAVAKRELADVPALGAFLRFADVLFVDRADRDQSESVLDAAVTRLRAGTSVVMEPEGTRAVTPDLGPFRTGAFRLAARAGVPVVPVVLRNTTDVMARAGLLLRPGRVEVAVLPPVETRGWRERDIRRHTDRVRAAVERTLRCWPSPDSC